MPEQLAPQIMRERACLARNRFKNAVWPIYGTTRPEKATVAQCDLTLVGSCVLITLEDRHYGITAAHVTDWTKRTPLWFPRGNDFYPIHGILHESIAPGGKRENDSVDSCWFEIPESESYKFRFARFVTVREMSHSLAPPDTRFFMAYGYPGSKNKKLTVTPITRRMLSITDCMPDISDLPHEFISSRPHCLFLQYWPKAIEGEDGNRRNAIEPKGLSGGALIDLGDFSTPDTSTQDGGAPPLIAGLLLEHHKAHKVIVAVDVQVIIRRIKQYAH